MVISAGHCPLTGRYGIWALFIISNVPSQMTYEERAQKFHTDEASLPISGWCFWLVVRVENLIQPIRSTTQIWVVTRDQYGISALVSQTSFGGETSGSVAKCRLFSQATLSWYAWRTGFDPCGVKRFYSCPSSRPLNSISFNSSNVGNIFLELNSKRLSKMKKARKNIEFYMEKLYQPFFSLSNKNQQQGLHSFVTSMFYSIHFWHVQLLKSPFSST